MIGTKTGQDGALSPSDADVEKTSNVWSSSSSISSNSKNVQHAPRSRVQLDEMHEILAQKHGVKRKLLQAKIDAWIVLPICLLYLLAFLDRVNISNANGYGMSEDLHLESNQYNVALAVFFVPYIVFEVPANWLLKRFKPHVFLPICLVCFGAVSIGQGFVKNYHELIVTRVLLGLFETAMFPSCFYLLGSWYTRDEAQKRYSFFFCSTSLAGAFGGLIAYGMNTLDMKQGIEGWRWIYIVEGAITGACGILLFFLIADFPEQAKFLNASERSYIQEKLAIDQGKSNFDHQVNLKDVGSVFKDWKVYCVAFMYFFLICGAYGYAYFSVPIIKTFGYSAVETQVHSIYPWVTTFGVSMVVAIASDFLQHRFGFTIGCLIISIVGYGLLLGTEPVQSNAHVRYAACFLVAVGLYSSMPLIVCWANMNFSGHTRKMVASAFQVGFGNIAGIISVFVYRNQDAPKYTLGLWVSLGGVLLSLGSCTLYFLGIMRTNHQRNHGKGLEDWNHLSDMQKETAGDLSPEFRYMY